MKYVNRMIVYGAEENEHFDAVPIVLRMATILAGLVMTLLIHSRLATARTRLACLSADT